jgi:ankyrin repeat protein
MFKAETALMLAAKNGHNRCVGELLNKGAHTHATDNEGWTALMFASQSGHDMCARALLKAGSDVNKASMFKAETALMLAAKNGHNRCVGELLNKGAHTHATDNEGWTALMLASKNGHDICVHALLKAEFVSASTRELVYIPRQAIRTTPP